MIQMAERNDISGLLGFIGRDKIWRERLQDAGPVTVREKSASRTLKQWDRIAVRVVPARDHHVISGALLPFSSEATDLLLSGLRDALKLKKRDPLRLTFVQLSGYGPIFTTAWLFTEIARALDPAVPELFNSEGDEVMFHDLRFPFATGATQKQVAAGLDKVRVLLPEGPKFWNWIALRKGRGARPASGTLLESQMESGETVLGTLELKGKALLISVNSARRAEEAEALVSKAVGELLKPPLTTIRTVEQMMAERRSEERGDAAEDIPPEIARQITRDYMDRHYRETLDAPLPMLGGKSPRQAARSATGREKVVEWLKYLENGNARREGGASAEYDFSWMWVELGLEGHRK